MSWPSERLLTGDEAGLDRQLLDGPVDGGLGDAPGRCSDSSNRMRPGLTTATQRSGLPLPEPMRVSAGFSVTGLSGKTLIQTLPPRLMWRVMAIRAASIWRAVIQPGLEGLDAVVAEGDLGAALGRARACGRGAACGA